MARDPHCLCTATSGHCCREGFKLIRTSQRARKSKGDFKFVPIGEKQAGGYDLGGGGIGNEKDAKLTRRSLSNYTCATL